MNHSISPKKYEERLNQAVLYDEAGKITRTLGLMYEAYLPGASIGSICDVILNEQDAYAAPIEAEIVGFKDKRVFLMPFDEVSGINNDSIVRLKQKNSSVPVSRSLLGRVIDGRGMPIDGKGPLFGPEVQAEYRSLYRRPTDPLSRTMIEEPLDLGVRAINGLLTCGRGQRMGIMAGSGVGKSVLLGMMAQKTAADVNVIALIGERGREVREFIERDLGPEGLKRSVVIVATSDSSALVRTRASFLAATIAEFFRDDGNDVLLMMDSVTRFCMAQREIGLSLGEPPASKGYTPSVFAQLPRLLERAGTGPNGKSITGLYTVLVDGDDMDEPIADAARSILDGHIVLSRKLAQRNHFPAIDILASASRVMNAVTSEDQKLWAGQVKEWMAIYQQAEDLINIGAYAKGSNPRIDQAIAVHERIQQYLRQKTNDSGDFSESLGLLHGIYRSGEAFAGANRK
ncbi:MAG: FliI/YscN family ATPase [Bdellovibrionales bacterium]|nr:FliI/YscN family ATPase [Bdellovibrionales bacterium]